MKCFVTGASGFLGANLVHELNARGHEVRALLRPGADLRGLAGATYEPVTGDLADGALLARALRGCDWCFHTAASYHLWLPDYAPMFATNVEGTRRVLVAAEAAGCSRIVYTSTAACVGGAGGTRGDEAPADEARVAGEAEMNNPYKLSKWRAEAVALEAAGRGLPVVVVNPTAPVGARDVKPTPTGRIILDFLRGRMPAYMDTGLNWVPVRDVAAGHVLAAERGRIGQRYILGHAAANWTLREMLLTLAEVAGRPAPRLRLPYWAALVAALGSEAWSGVSGRPPRVPLAGVRMARRKMFFNPARAVHELGLPQTNPKEALAEAVHWFRAQNYVAN